MVPKGFRKTAAQLPQLPGVTLAPKRTNGSVPPHGLQQAGLGWGEPRWLAARYHQLQFTVKSGKLAGAQARGNFKQHLRQPMFLLDLDVSQRALPLRGL